MDIHKMQHEKFTQQKVNYHDSVCVCLSVCVVKSDIRNYCLN